MVLVDLLHMQRRGYSSRLAYRHVEARPLDFTQSRLGGPLLGLLFPIFWTQGVKRRMFCLLSSTVDEKKDREGIGAPSLAWQRCSLSNRRLRLPQKNRGIVRSCAASSSGRAPCLGRNIEEMGREFCPSSSYSDQGNKTRRILPRPTRYHRSSYQAM